jgi:ferrous iron transport protein B
LEKSVASNKAKRIALIGNPNLGKTTLFNKLCGLNQKTGNYPGVTVDKKIGSFIHNDQKVEVVDLPGLNSLFPKSKDEDLVLKYLLNYKDEEFPDKLLILASALNLKRTLYLFDQLRDLNIPCVLVINMVDLAEKRGVFIDGEKLSRKLDTPVVLISAKKGIGLEGLKDEVLNEAEYSEPVVHYIEEENQDILAKYCAENNIDNQYEGYLRLTSADLIDSVEESERTNSFNKEHNINVNKWKTNESILRYKRIKETIGSSVTVDKSKAIDLTTRLDKVLVHRFWGYAIFGVILFTIFQSVFLIASYPMDWIDLGFASLSEWMSSVLPEGYFSDLLAKGVIPGIGGIVIFVPQIAILFFLFSILEETGYMQRIVFLMDRLMQKFGMSGKSVVPMISGWACAIPAIMAARTIENKKERLITILVTPLMTCSARIPVYVIIIALIIPDGEYIGIFHAQGLALMGMYLVGVVMTLVVAIILKWILKTDFKSFLIIDMPEYLLPDFRNVMISVWNNVKSFVWNAGKIILATSIILFVMATNGSDSFSNAQTIVEDANPGLIGDELDAKVATFELENSYLGMMGKSIEPAIVPLGYDWKIGIALISSLAAREVFVGTMSTIYAINSEEEMTIRDRLKNEKYANGTAIFSLATSISLLMFYAFALQCLSTVAVTYKETKSLKWSGIQFVYMTALAYFAALITYQLLK